MKRFYVLTFIAFQGLMQPAIAQNYSLSFDGVNDYVDLGTSAITGVRTFELWFTPTVTITPALADYAILVGRDDATQSNEISLNFGPSSFLGAEGRLVFARNNGSVNYIVSDANTWTGRYVLPCCRCY